MTPTENTLMPAWTIPNTFGTRSPERARPASYIAFMSLCSPGRHSRHDRVPGDEATDRHLPRFDVLRKDSHELLRLLDDRWHQQPEQRDDGGEGERDRRAERERGRQSQPVLESSATAPRYSEIRTAMNSSRKILAASRTNTAAGR